MSQHKEWVAKLKRVDHEAPDHWGILYPFYMLCDPSTADKTRY